MFSLGMDNSIVFFVSNAMLLNVQMISLIQRVSSIEGRASWLGAINLCIFLHRGSGSNVVLQALICSHFPIGSMA